MCAYANPHTPQKITYSATNLTILTLACAAVVNRYRAEDVSIIDLCEQIDSVIHSDSMCVGLSEPPARVSFRNRDRIHAQTLEWTDLQQADEHLAGKAMAMARRYGYTVL
jgi:hypothetical protein